jgi:hypothetical protein
MGPAVYGLTADGRLDPVSGAAGRRARVGWVDAGSRASVLAGYQQAGRRLGLDSGDDGDAVAVRVCAWLRSSSRRWLMVLDGLADPDDMAELWPDGGAGRVLVTASAVPAERFGWQPAARWRPRQGLLVRGTGPGRSDHA